jgi:hypothetical protein
MCPTRSYSGQHLVQGMVHRRLLIRDPFEVLVDAVDALDARVSAFLPLLVAQK